MSVFPGGIAGSVTPAGLPPNLSGAERYCGPSGSDSNVGDNWSRPLKYFKTAWNQLVALGGGTLYFGDGTATQANGKGLKISGNTDFVDPNGLHAASIQCIGVGGISFGLNVAPAARLIGGAGDGSSDQDDPQLWITNTSGFPMSFQNLYQGAGIKHPIRIGWDYTRDDAGAIRSANITNATRSSGSTVMTAAGVSFVLEKLSLTSNVLKVFIKLRVGQVIPIHPGMIATIVCAGESINASGEVLAYFSDTWTGYNGFTIALTHANISAVGTIGGPSIGSVSSHLVAPRDYVTVTSNNSEFPSSPYKVTAITATTFTVNDTYGYSPRSASANQNNIGTYAPQDRFGFPAGRIQLHNIAGSCQTGDAQVETFSNGPYCDVGSLIYYDFQDWHTIGFNIKESGGANFGCRDIERRQILTADGGSNPSGMGFGTFKQMFGGYGGIRYHGPAGGSQFADFDTISSETPANGDWISVPVLDILELSTTSTVTVRNASVPDVSLSTIPTIRVATDIAAAAVTVSGCYGPVEGPATIVNSGPNQILNANLPNELAQCTYYGNRLISGRHPGIARSGSPAMAALGVSKCEQAPPFSSAVGLTITGGQRDPFGGLNAWKVVADGSDRFLIMHDADITVNTGATGDFYCSTMWFRGENGYPYAYQQFIMQSDDAVKLQVDCYMPLGGGEPGEWDTPYGGGYTVGQTETNARARIYVPIKANHTIYFYLPCQWQSPVADRATKVTTAECAEILTNLAPVPVWLTAGNVGTQTGQKFIAHGGIGTLGTNSKTAGVGSGQLTLTGTGTVYLPTYDEDGTTILGWVAQLQATVNP